MDYEHPDLQKNAAKNEGVLENMNASAALCPDEISFLGTCLLFAQKHFCGRYAAYDPSPGITVLMKGHVSELDCVEAVNLRVYSTRWPGKHAPVQRLSKRTFRCIDSGSGNTMFVQGRYQTTASTTMETALSTTTMGKFSNASFSHTVQLRCTGRKISRDKRASR